MGQSKKLYKVGMNILICINLIVMVIISILKSSTPIEGLQSLTLITIMILIGMLCYGVVFRLLYKLLKYPIARVLMKVAMIMGIVIIVSIQFLSPAIDTFNYAIGVGVTTGAFMGMYMMYNWAKYKLQWDNEEQQWQEKQPQKSNISVGYNDKSKVSGKKIIIIVALCFVGFTVMAGGVVAIFFSVKKMSNEIQIPHAQECVEGAMEAINENNISDFEIEFVDAARGEAIMKFDVISEVLGEDIEIEGRRYKGSSFSGKADEYRSDARMYWYISSSNGEFTINIHTSINSDESLDGIRYFSVDKDGEEINIGEPAKAK
ncbi:MAG: hypothetical protein ACK5LL_15730 [Suipraeoptans sp.]